MTIDIMLPYYGEPFLLKTAVRSIQAQDDPDWRLTVVDDAYPDESVAVWFDELSDERIHYRRNPRTLGLPGNYQKCLDLIEHDVVVLMGADDIMLPNYVRTIRRLHRAHPRAGVIQPGVAVIDSDGRPYRNLVDEAKQRLYAPKAGGPRVLGGERLAISILRGNWLYFPALAFRAEALRRVGFRHFVDSVHDLALVIDLLQHGELVVLDPTVCFRYRRHRASDSSERALSGTRFADERNYFLDVAERLDAHGWHRAATVARAHISSRLHALTLLPQALRQQHGVRGLVRHAFGPSKYQRT
jgi:glycosyltransferase involved in cell wall biosynthesis